MVTHLRKGVLTVICLALIRLWVSAQDIHFTVVPAPKSDQPVLTTGMSQDPQGFLWLATNSGLYKYDGSFIQSYHNSPTNINSLAFNRLESVLADKDGMIWIGTFGAGLDRLDPFTGKFTHYRHSNNSFSIANDTVNTITKDRDGALWLGTNGGLDRFDPSTGKFAHYRHNNKDGGSLSDNQVRVVYEDKAGVIWVGCGSVFTSDNPEGKGGLNKMDKKTGRFTRFLHDEKDPNSLTDSRVRAIFEDSRGTFWIGTAGDGLYNMNRKTGTFEHHAYDPAHPDKLSRPALKDNIVWAKDHITFITEDINGMVWIGTMQNGVNVYNPATKKITHYGADKLKTGLTTNDLWYTYRTRDGVLWISAYSVPEGVVDLFKINPYQSALPHRYLGKKVTHVFEDSSRNLWIGTRTGLMVDNNKDIQNVVLDHAYKGGLYINFLEKDKETNNIWVSSLDGLFYLNPETKSARQYRHEANKPTSLFFDTLTNTSQDNKGKIWVGLYRHGIDLMDPVTGTFQHFQHHPADPNSLRTDSIWSIYTEKNGKLWVTTEKGLNTYNSRTHSFNNYAGLLVNALFTDDNGSLWAGTKNGLFLYNKASKIFYRFADVSGMITGSTGVYSFCEDTRKNLWMASTLGLIKLNLPTREAVIFGKSRGFNAATLTDFIFRRHNGELLVGDSTGCYAFKSDSLLASEPQINVSIDNFSLSNKVVIPAPGGILTAPVQHANEISLKHNQNTFSFAFEGINYLNDEENYHLLYKLENYDNDWRPGQDNKTAYYFNVPPGNYVFKVKASNSDGVWTEKSVTVTILPPWWQTWWAYLIFAFAIGVSIWMLVQYHSQQLRNENMLLEEKVQLRTGQLSKANKELQQQQKEITLQRDELSRTVKNLKTTQTQLIQAEKMASLGELTAGIAHEIQNPLNFVTNFSELSVELLAELEEEVIAGNKKAVVSIANDLVANLEKVRTHGKRADSIVKGMLQHSRINKGEPEQTDINKLATDFFKISYNSFKEKNRSLNVNLVAVLDETLPEINIVNQDLGRVFFNLFNNALYAVEQKEKMQLKDFKAEVTVATLIENRQMVVKIKDNGIGIPAAIRNKIMHPFFTTKPPGEGTGLGLSLSYDIVVKGHGGNIDINSEEGEGSEFIVRLPLI